MKIYALLDKKTNSYMPFFCPNVIEAKRSLFIELNNGEDTLLNNSPNDFSLWLLGEVFNDGIVKTVVSPIFVEECFNLVDKPIEMVQPKFVNFEED